MYPADDISIRMALLRRDMAKADERLRAELERSRLLCEAIAARLAELGYR